MPKLTKKDPGDRRHYSGQGIVTLDGADYDCGPYEVQSSRDQQDDASLAGWPTAGGCSRRSDKPSRH